MKKLLSLVLVMVCVMSMLGCNLKSDAEQSQAGELQKEDINTQYFFSAKRLNALAIYKTDETGNVTAD